jgi:hypothetical protein
MRSVAMSQSQTASFVARPISRFRSSDAIAAVVMLSSSAECTSNASSAARSTPSAAQRSMTAARRCDSSRSASASE